VPLELVDLDLPSERYTALEVDDGTPPTANGRKCDTGGRAGVELAIVETFAAIELAVAKAAKETLDERPGNNPATTNADRSLQADASAQQGARR
jgi:hypothetical protein